MADNGKPVVLRNRRQYLAIQIRAATRGLTEKKPW